MSTGSGHDDVHPQNHVMRLYYPRPTPTNHETLTQCWINVGLMSKTVAQHQINIGLTYLVCVASVHEDSL